MCANDRVDRFLVLAGSFDSPSRGLGSNGAGERELFSHLCFALPFFFYIALLKKKKSLSTAARLGQLLKQSTRLKKKKKKHEDDFFLVVCCSLCDLLHNPKTSRTEHCRVRDLDFQ